MARKGSRYEDAEVGIGRIYRIKDLEEYGLVIPEGYKACAVCRGRAVYLQTFHTEAKREGVGFMPPDAVGREFIEEVRHWAGSNIELPFCEEHKGYGEVVN